MTSIRKSFAWSFLDKYSLLAIQFGTSMILARMMTPAAFGVFALAFAIVGFAHRIREMGVASYLVRQPDLQPIHVRSALLATGIVAWGLALLLFAALPLVGHLFGPDVRRATMVLLLNFVIMPFSSTITPVLQRELNFSALMWINTSGVLANSLSAIVLAEAGSGYMALAWGSVIGQLVGALVAAAQRPHKEHFLPAFGGVRNVFRFGSGVMLATMLQQFSTNAANLVIARFVTLDAIGLFTRAQTVTGLYARLVMEAVSPLVLPVLSLMHRRGEKLEPACRQGFAYLMVVIWPFYGFLALYADTLIVVLFGPQWEGAAILLRLAAIAGMLECVQPLAEPLLIAVGRVGLVVRAQLINQSVTVTLVVIGAMHGIVAVAQIWIVISAVHSITWMYHLRRIIRIPAVDLLRLAGTGAGVTAAALAVPMILLHEGQTLGMLPNLMLATAGLGIGWLAGIFAVRHPMAQEIRLVLRRLVPAVR